MICINFFQHICGAFLITDRWALTAAHCVFGIDQYDLSILFGSISRTNDDKNITYAIEEKFVHHLYNNDTSENDIALLKIWTIVEMTPFIAPAQLGKEIVGGGVEVVVSGWGRMSQNGPSADNLQYLNVKTLTNPECIEKMTFHTNDIFDTSICTIAPVGQG